MGKMAKDEVAKMRGGESGENGENARCECEGEGEGEWDDEGRGCEEDGEEECGGDSGGSWWPFSFGTINMSMQNKNLFTLLGNDVSDDESDFVVPKEIVAPQKSNKKSGVPPKADKTKAKGGKSSTTGNEAGAKFSNKNKTFDGPKSTQRKAGKDKKFDRHSRTGRQETNKSQHNKLGDEAEAQIEGEEDAEAEIAEADAENAENENKPKLISAVDFFAEKENDEFNKIKSKNFQNSEINDADLIVKEVEEFIPSKTEKKVKQKAKKEKIYLDISVSHGFETPERPQRSDFKRGPRNAGKDGKKFGGKPKAPKPVKVNLSEENCPAL